MDHHIHNYKLGRTGLKCLVLNLLGVVGPASFSWSYLVHETQYLQISKQLKCVKYVFYSLFNQGIYNSSGNGLCYSPLMQNDGQWMPVILMMMGCHMFSETLNVKITVCLHLRPAKVTCSLRQFHPQHLMSLAMMEVSFAWYMVYRNPTNHLLQTLNTTVVVLWIWYLRT